MLLRIPALRQVSGRAKFTKSPIWKLPGDGAECPRDRPDRHETPYLSAYSHYFFLALPLEFDRLMSCLRPLMQSFALAATIATALSLGGCNGDEQKAASSSRPLPALGAKTDETSVSGISSGAYMAGQFQMAHAKRVVGAAIIAGGPYG